MGEVLEEKNIRLGNGDLLSVTLGKGVVKASELDRKDNSSSDKSKYKMVEKKDIVYNTMRMWQGALGISKYSGIVSPAYTVLSSKNKFDPHFISILFKQSKMIYLFGAYSQGLTSDTWTLKYNSLSKIVAKFPSFDEQVKIYSIFDRLNTLITLYQRKIGLLQQLKKAMLQRLFPDTDTYPKLRFGGFSGPWEQHKLGDVFYTVSDKGHSELPVLMATQQQGMIYRTDSSINIIHDKKAESNYKRVIPDDFVIHLRSFQGGFAYSNIEGITSPAYTILRIKDKEREYPKFWKHIFMSESFINSLRKVTYGIRDGRTISSSESMKLKYLVPSIVEQKMISKFIDRLDTLIALQQHKLDNMNKLKKFMLQQMFI